MKSLVAAVLLLSQSDASQEETSLMQGLVARHTKLSAGASKDSRKDATAQLMETATKMMRNGVTPDVVTFIETTITELNQNVLGAIVEEHHRDQQLINDLLQRFDDAVAAMEECAASVVQQHEDRTQASIAHKMCRSGEAIDCARSRKCEEELEELWSIVKLEEQEMRRIHDAIHGEWCVGPAPDHPGLADPFHWRITEYSEGAETSESVNDYPEINLEPVVIEFRRFNVEYFGHYIVQKPRVEEAWNNYNAKLIECAALEETWTLKVDECDGLQDVVHEQACMHASSNRQCASNFGHEYHMTEVAYEEAKTAIMQLEHDRKREWETLKIVTCLLETVYTHVIHSIDSGEPCPTTESHPEQTEEEINFCHVVEESLTANLTIDYGEPPPPPPLPPVVEPPCTAQYLWDEHGSFTAEIQASHSQTITAEGLHDYFTVLSAYGWAGCAAPKACTPCESTDLVVDPAYIANDVCKEHHAHLRPGQLDFDTFKCLSGDECVRSDGRCNGVANCDDGSDELGCETDWGVPAILQKEECQEPFISDVQFRCHDNTCTHIAGRCNGVNNCADGSDEVGCATTSAGVTLEASTGYEATIEVPSVGERVFTDRLYTFTSLGSFTGQKFIKMANEDKHIRHSHVQMKVRLPQPEVVYVAKLDDKELPWLIEDGWSMTALEGVTYRGIHETRHTEWDADLLQETEYGPGAVWQKVFPAGTVELRGNNGGDGSYVMFVANPANPPTPTIGELWSEHSPERMKCNWNEGLVYVADQAACQMHAIANGHPYYSFRHNAVSRGHKCFSSATCDFHDDRTNDWRIYTNIIELPIIEEPICCQAIEATCLACSAMVSVEAYCAHNPTTPGCPTTEPVYDCALSAYWEFGNCGCNGNDFNQNWCGGIGRGQCPETVSTNICPTGTAVLAAFNGQGGVGATRGAAHNWNHQGCEYIWHAQYVCEPELIVEPIPIELPRPIMPHPGCEGLYEAEEARLFGAVVHADTASLAHQGFTGRSFVDYINPSGDFVHWSIESCNPHPATLTFRYALADPNGRPLRLSVNGVDQEQVDFPFCAGNWASYCEVSVSTEFTAGINTVKLTATGRSGANMDSLRVTDNTPPGRGGCWETAGGLVCG